MTQYRINLRRIAPAPGHTGHEVECADDAEALHCAERMARETGRAEGETWEIAWVGEPKTGRPVSVPANDRIEDDVTLPMTMPAAAWQGLLRAAQAGMEAIGAGDRDALAGYALLKASVATMDKDIRPVMGCPREERR